MLCLTDEVRGHNKRIRLFIGKDQTVGWTGNHINPYATKKHPFGFGDKLIARTHKDICLWQTKQSVGHGCHPLHPAHGEDFIRAAYMGCIDYNWYNPDPCTWWGTGNDIVAPCHFGGGHRHNCACYMIVATAGDITSRRIHGDGFLSGDETGNNFDFEICHCRFLCFSKAPHVFMCK